jgi:hypothetical protein
MCLACREFESRTRHYRRILEVSEGSLARDLRRLISDLESAKRNLHVESPREGARASNFSCTQELEGA